MALTRADATALGRCAASGGVAVFPADTVYGLGCAPGDAAAVARLHALKGRAIPKPAAVLFGTLDAALAELEDVLAAATRAAMAALLPGAVTLLVADARERWPAASGTGAAGAVLGVRVPAWPAALAALAGLPGPLLQSSANTTGAPDARELRDVPVAIRAGADLLLDGGALPGTPSTVVDLCALADGGVPVVLREGAVAAADVLARLAG